MKKGLFLSILALTALFSCQVKEDFAPIEGADRIPLNINGEISQIPTRATAAGFVNGDGLGLYAVNYSENNTVAGQLLAEGNQGDNVRYVFDEANHSWNPVKSVYYKDINTNVDLYVYYPHQTKISEINAYPFEVRKDQSETAEGSSLCAYEASDFMWCKVENVTPTESKIRVILKHRLSAANVILEEGTGFNEGEFESLSKSVILTNTTRKATIDFATGEATPVGDPQFDGIVMAPQGDGSYRAIVIPQAVPAATQLFAITIDGVSYSYKKSAEETVYVSGKMSQFTLKLNKKTPAGDYELVLTDCQIVDWVEDRNTHEGEARQYFVVNVETPGTLGRMIKSMGKNPDKIKSLKVTGSINQNDFFFMRDSMAIVEAVNLKEVKIKDVFERGNAFEIPIGSDIPDNYVVVHNPCLWDSRMITVADRNDPNTVIVDNVIPTSAFWEKKSLYSFVFPEYLEAIDASAFQGSNISGALEIPDGVKIIGGLAFSDCNLVTSLSLPNSVEKIEDNAFYNCTALSGTLYLPAGLKEIGESAFFYCSFSGNLHLPDKLTSIGSGAFYNCGSFSCDLKIPDFVNELHGYTFFNTYFTGQLDLNNIKTLGENEFTSSGFQGELIIPEGVEKIPQSCFYANGFTSIVFPSTLKEIDNQAFIGNGRLFEPLVFNEGLLSIQNYAFKDCGNITSITFPSTLLHIGTMAFCNCFNVSDIVCNATEVPIVNSGAFDGVQKDNFTVEVPEKMVSRYQAAPGWEDFRRIGGHYDFAISRDLMRGLNKEAPRTYVLRCPSGFDWSIESKPDWVSVTPDHGTGKTEVTIAFDEMPRTNEPMMNLDNVYEQIGVGRNGEIVFLLDEKDYTSTMTVEQYDSDYSDGDVITLHEATAGAGIDIIYIGDGYDARDIANGVFTDNASEGNTSFFDIEPYKTYKDYFNVYAVVSESYDSGIGTENTVKDAKFGSYITSARILAPDPEGCFMWAGRARSGIDFSKSLVILLQNSSVYEGVTMMYSDGSAIACCPVSRELYPYDFRGIIQHEAGGHGFGKLGDEYIYHNAYIQICQCQDGCDHPQTNYDQKSHFGRCKELGWFKNLDMESDMNLVPWSHLIFHPKYSNYVDVFEGGYMHSRGMFRSEATSCMNNNIPYYSAISRQAIVERIMEYAGEEFTLEKFYAKDSRDFGSTTKSSMPFDWTFGVDPKWNRGNEHGSIIYMGEHPEL